MSRAILYQSFIRAHFNRTYSRSEFIYRDRNRASWTNLDLEFIYFWFAPLRLFVYGKSELSCGDSMWSFGLEGTFGFWVWWRGGRRPRDSGFSGKRGRDFKTSRPNRLLVKLKNVLWEFINQYTYLPCRVRPHMRIRWNKIVKNIILAYLVWIGNLTSALYVYIFYYYILLWMFFAPGFSLNNSKLKNLGIKLSTDKAITTYSLYKQN